MSQGTCLLTHPEVNREPLGNEQVDTSHGSQRVLPARPNKVDFMHIGHTKYCRWRITTPRFRNLAILSIAKSSIISHPEADLQYT